MIIPILAVESVEASSAFYTHNLGFSELFNMPGEDGSAMFAMVSSGPGVNVGLSKQPGLANKGVGAVFMLYVSEETDIDAYYEEVKSRGTAIEKEIGDEFWGDRTFSVKDPDGYYVSLCKTVKQVSIEAIQSGGTQG
ncbi:MAG: VOC family protein [Fimbriimonadaceae bacterium]|nr:VOC family protein [Fimbriimonadaceae bacterium]